LARYQIKGSGDHRLNAAVDINAGVLTLHSRSGKSASGHERNPDYVRAFDAIFDRINVASVVVDRVLLDSTPARLVAEQDRTLASRADFETGVLAEVKNSIRHKMRKFGRTPDMPAGEGNANKKIRVETELTEMELVRRLRAVSVDIANAHLIESSSGSGIDFNQHGRLPHSELRKVTPDHVAFAIERLLTGERPANFEVSRDYDARTLDGKSFAPKMIFAFALEAALNIEVLPSHFNAGWGTPCFEILEASGLWIAPKGSGPDKRKVQANATVEATAEMVVSDEERTWIEGNPKIVTHLKRERQAGLAKEKRKHFIEHNGRLFCERCKMDPVSIYGVDAGEACIEVHHHRIRVADMGEANETRLEDLKCLCANCHRVLHRALTIGVPFEL
jgi:5-methylcytosine-specific restriction protein A